MFTSLVLSQKLELESFSFIETTPVCIRCFFSYFVGVHANAVIEKQLYARSSVVSIKPTLKLVFERAHVVCKNFLFFMMFLTL